MHKALELKFYPGVEGQEKTYVAPTFISGRVFRETVKVEKTLKQRQESKQFDVEDLDFTADYVVLVFGKQFTRDEFYDGISVEDVVTAAQKCIQHIVTKVNSAASGGATPNA
ncbi:hypothetical protein OS242_10600 [Tumebacillus sp. DT12]|uniref:Phage protein n=1 Tax=Tumebacillus lacus TaxID=2995335 RepID=A0ABT3X3L1_9BACL|nr:hypothetical protein [Tumebacillus lacus]MCX7570412.1 hypothetical protein [Tumebacillus lacus]